MLRNATMETCTPFLPKRIITFLLLYAFGELFKFCGNDLSPFAFYALHT